MGDIFGWDDEPGRRSLSVREKEVLYKNAKHKCQNCKKIVYWEDMQVGHKKAWSRGGSTTIKNSVCLCSKCNRLMGTRNWEQFQKEQGKQIEVSPETRTKEFLTSLSADKLKLLAKKHNIKVKGSVEEGLLQDTYISPSKAKYVNALSKRIQEKDIQNSLKNLPETKKRRRNNRSNSDFVFKW